MKNRICELLKIEYPIFQGGMAWLGTAELAAAVSDAGGLGIIGCGNADANYVEEQIKKIRELTDKPFGVNVMLLSPYADDIMDLVCREEVSVVTTGAGNPGKYFQQLKEKNIKIIPVVPSTALAKRMEKNGADAVIVEGTEAGGHVGEITTFSLVPQVADVVSIPVVAAGGIADGRGVVASMALGAEAVQIGTRFICSDECIAHENFKNAIIKAKDRDAVITGRSTGHPVRNLKNSFTKEFDRLEEEGVSAEELEELGKGALRNAAIEGNVYDGSIMAGQVSGMIKNIASSKVIIEDIMNQTKEVMERLNSLLK